MLCNFVPGILQTPRPWAAPEKKVETCRDNGRAGMALRLYAFHQDFTKLRSVEIWVWKTNKFKKPFKMFKTF